MPDDNSARELIEDGEANRFIFGTALRESALKVLEAATGGDGLRLARDNVPDLILLDIGLPDISGIRVAGMLPA